jgi:hypothetical protein
MEQAGEQGWGGSARGHAAFRVLDTSPALAGYPPEGVLAAKTESWSRLRLMEIGHCISE